MSNLIKNFARWVLFGTGKRIRIDPDHLPGLRPPKSGPPIPPLPRPNEPEITYLKEIDDLYRRFKSAPRSRSKASSKQQQEGNQIDWKF